MPYINQQRRHELDTLADKPRTPGELNYSLTKVCTDYLDVRRVDYTALNQVIGALEACKLEFYRRLVSQYEDQKIKENGDVY